jgi:alkanesulfonate monooxygenase SsuD/methylene tetrahydromethanopterin reductase-like flavin-dependent oxidoreductase (luciferase family)
VSTDYHAVHAADSIRASVRAVRACNYEGPRIATFITAADTDADAQRLFTSVQQMTLSRLRGTLLPFLPEPVADFDALANAEERQRTDAAARAAINGSAQSLETQLMAMLEKTGADEIMALSFIHDLNARRRSLEIIAQARERVHARQR